MLVEDILEAIKKYLPDKRLDASCAAVDLIKCDFANDLRAVVSGEQTLVCMRDERLVSTDFLSFLTFSISAGTLSAKVSFKL